MPGTKLANVSQIRREMLRLYREAEAGRLPPGTAYVLTQILGMAARLMTVSEPMAELAPLRAEAAHLYQQVAELEALTGCRGSTVARRRRLQ